MDGSNTIIRVFSKNPTGPHETLLDDCKPADFGGVVPSVGDTIVSRGVVVEGVDRNQPENRTVYRVLHRYFLTGPVGSDLVRIGLLVDVRRGRSDEVNILGG